jgi:hypothetical protein
MVLNEQITYFNIYKRLEKYSFSELKYKLDTEFKTNKKKILKLLSKNNYKTKIDLIESSEYTYFYLINQEILNCSTLMDIKKYFYNKYNVKLDQLLLDKCLIKNSYNNNTYLDWNYLNLIQILVDKKFKEENINKFLFEYDGEFIENLIINQSLYINFKELIFFNEKFILNYLEELNYLKNDLSNISLFSQYHLNFLKENYDIKSLQKINVKIKNKRIFHKPTILNELTDNKYYFIENSNDLLKFSHIFNNCINSKKYENKLIQEEILLIIDLKNELVIEFSTLLNNVVEIKGKNNLEIDEFLIKKIEKELCQIL